MKSLSLLSTSVLFVGLATAIQAHEKTVVVTASNASQNQLLVYNTSGKLIQTVATQGQGGVSGNSGGIAAKGGLVAVVNFGSQSVSILEFRNNAFEPKRLVANGLKPVSVAFGARPSIHPRNNHQ